jgi:hypothetical protein
VNSKEALLRIADNLKELSKIVVMMAEEMTSTNVTKKEEIKPDIKKEEVITIEQVRAVLAEKSQSGKQPEVKALILKFGANKLTDVDPSHYKALLMEAGEL